MNVILETGKTFAIELILLLLSPLFLAYRKRIILLLEKCAKHSADKFARNLARRNRYYEFSMIALVMVVALHVAVMSEFEKSEISFELMEKDFKHVEVVSDSLYNRSYYGKLKFKTPLEEIRDIESEIKMSEESTLNSLQMSMMRQRQLPKVSSAIDTIAVILLGVKISLYAIGAALFLLFLVAILKLKLIGEFEWKIIRLRSVKTNKVVLAFETEWANLTSWDQYLTLMNRLDEELKIAASRRQ